MLYLIQDRDYLKIGFSDNIDQRTKAYETTNCYAKIIMVREGTRADEKELHSLCKEWKYKNEWFYYNEEIIEIFKNYNSSTNIQIEKLRKELNNSNQRINVLEKQITGLVYNQKETLSIVNKLLNYLFRIENLIKFILKKIQF